MPWWNWLLPWKWVDLWRGPVSDPEPAQTASPVATSKAPWLADTSAGSSEAAVAQTVPTDSSNTDTSTTTEDQQTSQELQELQDQIAALQETVEELEEEVEQASNQTGSHSASVTSGSQEPLPELITRHTFLTPGEDEQTLRWDMWAPERGIDMSLMREAIEAEFAEVDFFTATPDVNVYTTSNWPLFEGTDDRYAYIHVEVTGDVPASLDNSADLFPMWNYSDPLHDWGWNTGFHITLTTNGVSAEIDYSIGT